MFYILITLVIILTYFRAKALKKRAEDLENDSEAVLDEINKLNVKRK